MSLIGARRLADGRIIAMEHVYRVYEVDGSEVSTLDECDTVDEAEAAFDVATLPPPKDPGEQ